MDHVMIDLETFGTSPGCAIRSIGAVLFDLDGGIGDTFYRNIRSMSCWMAGLTADPNTVRWWNNQSDEVRAKLRDDQRELAEVIDDFHRWFVSNQGKFVWCQGASFDEPIWMAAVKRLGREAPWRYYDVRDTRTLYYLGELDHRAMARDGVHHGALDDALHQTKCVHEAYRRLKNGHRT